MCGASRLTFTQMCCCSFSSRQETESGFRVTQSESPAAPSEHPASSPPLSSSLPASSSTHTGVKSLAPPPSIPPSLHPSPTSLCFSLSLCLTKSVHSHLISTRQNGDATTAGKVNYRIGREFLTAELCSSICRRFLSCWLLI